mmetsp:Transcript_71134/g.139744  ORF Transcript_71134/g.139744 Transcript_71134/m.139744 type:complete len:215 (-) Transcript_71134:344-988(-)
MSEPTTIHWMIYFGKYLTYHLPVIQSNHCCPHSPLCSGSPPPFPLLPQPPTSSVQSTPVLIIFSSSSLRGSKRKTLLAVVNTNHIRLRCTVLRAVVCKRIHDTHHGDIAIYFLAAVASSHAIAVLVVVVDAVSLTQKRNQRVREARGGRHGPALGHVKEGGLQGTRLAFDKRRQGCHPHPHPCCFTLLKGRYTLQRSSVRRRRRKTRSSVQRCG